METLPAWPKEAEMNEAEEDGFDDAAAPSRTGDDFLDLSPAVGAVMPSLHEMIAWSGSGAVLSLFIVASSEVEHEPTMSAAGYVPDQVTRYEMESVGRTAGFGIFEYDAHFDVVPEHLSVYLAACLDEALRCGALVAWFGFEGSFHFDHLLTPDITEQIYGVADASGIALVTEAAQLTEDGWGRRVGTAKEALPGSG